RRLRAPVCLSDPARARLYTLSLHDALPISSVAHRVAAGVDHQGWPGRQGLDLVQPHQPLFRARGQARRRGIERKQRVLDFGLQRSEEHTSELQSRENLVCRLLLEKKKNKQE